MQRRRGSGWESYSPICLRCVHHSVPVYIVFTVVVQIYVEVDADATACYMFFQRLACKAELVANVVGSANGLPDSLAGSVPESLVGVCEVGYHISMPWSDLTTLGA